MVPTNLLFQVSFPPFLFEVFLLNEINDEASKCTIIDKEIIFELQKKQKETWNELERKLDKQDKISERKKISECMLLRAEEERTSRKERLRELQNVAVQQQIDLESRNRSAVEEVKKVEKNRAMNELEAWKTKQLNIKEPPNNMEKPSRDMR